MAMPDLKALEDHLQQMELDLKMQFDHDAMQLGSSDARVILDKARQAAEDARRQVESQITNFRNRGPNPVFEFQDKFPTGPRAEESALYNSGLSAIQQRQYDRAIALFDRALGQKGSRADGALYWKAFAQGRLVRTDDALATLALLRKDYPQSRYLGEAKVLEADVRKMAGQKIDPQTLDANDEIKLLAINGIANTEPDRAIPLLEGVLGATNTLSNKKRALYVLALNEDPRAHQILLRYAKGAGSPELQAEAIRYLASRRDSPTRNAELKDIYESTQDVNVRRAIVDAYRSAGDKASLIAVAMARNENADIRRSALNSLSNLAAPPELWTLYQQEADRDLRLQMVSVFASMGAADQLNTIAKTDKDSEVRVRAVRSMGNIGSDRTGATLIGLYSTEQDRDVRRAVVQALGNQNNAEGLVAIARKEADLDLKREIVRRLSEMAPKNKVAAEYLMEVIK